MRYLITSFLVGSSSGPIMLLLDPFARPEEIRKQARGGTGVYKNREPVAGVGDEAVFHFNSAFAFLDVWTGSRSFSILMHSGFQEDSKELKPNVIALAKAIVPQLR